MKLVRVAGRNRKFKSKAQMKAFHAKVKENEGLRGTKGFWSRHEAAKDSPVVVLDPLNYK